MESILTSIKKLLGIDESYTHFDADIIMHINSALMVLTQLGVGPEEGFMIEDDTSTWISFISEENVAKIEAVKSYVYLKVKLLFDPPLSSAAIESINRQISELEWRLNVAADQKDVREEVAKWKMNWNIGEQKECDGAFVGIKIKTEL